MAQPIDYIDIGDLVALAAHQRRQKPVQPIEIWHHQKHLAPERLQSAAGVAGAIAQDRVAHAIGNAGLDLLEAGVLASDALARGETDAVAALLDRRNQIWQ